MRLRSGALLLFVTSSWLLTGCAPSSNREGSEEGTSQQPPASDTTSPTTPLTGESTGPPLQDAQGDANNPDPSGMNHRLNPPTYGELRCEVRRGTTLFVAEQWPSLAQQRAAAAIDCDAYEIMYRVWSANLSNEQTSAQYNHVLQLRAQAIESLRAGPLESSRLPLSDAHRDMYAVAAAAEREAGSAPLRAWATNPWRRLRPLDMQNAQPDALESLSTALMRGESRAIAFNIRNTSENARTVLIEIDVPGFAPEALQIHKVNWTGNDRSSWVAAELERLGDASTTHAIVLAPGITQQVWIEVHPARSVDVGQFTGNVLLHSEAEQVRVPMDLTLFHRPFPERPDIHFGGWDRTDGSIEDPQGVNGPNHGAIIEHLVVRYVDTPWALRQVMHWDDLGPDGTLTRPVESSDLEHWLWHWPRARRHRVQLNVTQDIAGIATTDPRFQSAVTNWARGWAAVVRNLGSSPEEFDLLLVDEPHTPQAIATTVAWARAIRASGTGFRVWSDPNYVDPLLTPRELTDAVDTIAIHFRFAEEAGQSYWEWARQLAAEGKSIEIYACEGPARRLDPYSYYRLAAWKAFWIGAAGITFWSFHDTGGVLPDHEFAAQRENYAPLFIRPDGVRPGKQMEGAAEGVQDTVYLQMLRAIARSHPDPDTRARGAELLQEVTNFIIRAPRLMDWQWYREFDRSEADRLRIRIGHFLDSVVT